MKFAAIMVVALFGATPTYATLGTRIWCEWIPKTVGDSICTDKAVRGYVIDSGTCCLGTPAQVTEYTKQCDAYTGSKKQGHRDYGCTIY